ncbi:Xaa-Pro dipeptidyl-peptidase [Fructilactobacillus florum]|uniref:Xaa-Pro dipeptidyl-peptidase n=1 Tax=Fructilactobacillus florum TaxID=640331 RepID=UPI00028E5551|nr:Xaa-Pro dipeptidyl-peptidase [Fructilactobacillus florum]EKK20548.1 Xaa-Pro dipeptidyl-peptidase [Fructilactobacillus florum 2F]
MKINQFATITTDYHTQLIELERVGFKTNTIGAKQRLAAYLEKVYWQQQQTGSLQEREAQLLATPTQTMASFLASKAPLTPTIFALLSLQLLGFLPWDDFDPNHPQTSRKNLGLAPIELVTTETDVARAWYQLLTTHTRFGLTYLDHLASQGYFTQPHFRQNQQLFFNGKTQATFQTNAFHHEMVYVPTDVDTDGDGLLDLIRVEITRPTSSVPVPAVYTASPYDQGTNDRYGEQLTHQVDVPLTRKQPAQHHHQPFQPLPRKAKSPVTEPATGQTLQCPPPHPGYTLNDYLLPRGFASVYAAGIGTIDSDGLQTCGDPAQTNATIAVIEWLHGDRPAFVSKNRKQAVAADWCNGNVAMTGRSYLGTLAIAAATTGVPGLKTIIPEAAISSWYDYYRENGLVVAPGGFQGEDCDVLAAETFSRRQRPGDYLKVQAAFEQELADLQQGQDRTSGSYNQFWDDRNYRNHLQQIKCDVLLVHGLNDENVKLKNPAALWAGLKDLPISKKLILHQGQHVYLNNFPSFDFTDIVNLWLSNKLYQCDNHVDQALPTAIVQDNLLPETWEARPNWLTAPQKSLPLTFNHASFQNEIEPATFKFYCQNPERWKTDLWNLADDRLANQRVTALIPHKTGTINGIPRLELTLSSSQPLGLISAMLLDYGEAHRLTTQPTKLMPNGMPLGYRWYTDNLFEFTLAQQPSAAHLIARGHLNLQNRISADQDQNLIANQFYHVELPLQPTYYHLLAERKLVVILFSTDFQMTIRGNQAITYQLQPQASRLILPWQTD